MKRIILIALLLLATIAMPAQKKNEQVHRPKVGIVLGGGGAKGASHIGALKYIEEMGIPVDYVAGTSMGSIIGGLYAMGYSPDELTKLISQLDWSVYIGNSINRPMMSEDVRQRNSTLLVNVPFSLENLVSKDSKSSFISQLPSAYVNNSSLVNLFNDLCVGYQEDMDFNDMPIPFACVATNVVTGEEVVLRSGSVPTAMRASMAIPGVFSPVKIGDMVLVDGGLVNNFPADVLRDMGADIIIGIEITKDKKLTRKDIQSLPQLLGQLVTNSTSGKRKENREMCDIWIVPDVSGFGMLSFTPDAIETLVGRGYEKAAEYHDQLEAIKQRLEKAAGGPVQKKLQAPKSLNLMENSVMISRVDINGVTEQQNSWLIRKSGLTPGTSYSKDKIENALNLFRGTGCFDEITYNVTELDSLHSDEKLADEYALSINMKPSHPHLVGLGLRYDTDEGAAILFHFGLNEKRFGGSKLSTSIKFSYNPRFNLTYTYSRASLANFSLAYDYRDEYFQFLMNDNNKTNLHAFQHKISGYISEFHLLNFNTTIGASLVSTGYDKTSLEGDAIDSIFLMANRQIMPFINLKYDNLNDAYFATHGIHATLSSHIYFEKDNPRQLPVDINYSFKAYLTPRDSRITIIPQLYGRSLFGSTMSFNIWSHAGGEIDGRHFDTQLPFIGHTQVRSICNHSAIARCDVRINIYGKHYLTAMYNTLMELNTYGGNLGENYDKKKLYFTHGAGLKYSYKSILGPISITGQWTNLDKNIFSAYFSFGYYF